jgi:hypothetical protein
MKTTMFRNTVFTGFVRAFGMFLPLVAAALPLTR